MTQEEAVEEIMRREVLRLYAEFMLAYQKKLETLAWEWIEWI